MVAALICRLCALPVSRWIWRDGVRCGAVLGVLQCDAAWDPLWMLEGRSRHRPGRSAQLYGGTRGGSRGGLAGLLYTGVHVLGDDALQEGADVKMSTRKNIWQILTSSSSKDEEIEPENAGNVQQISPQCITSGIKYNDMFSKI